ncbi:MAG: response regulator transcription factor [Chloroflexi bacterium]|nr:response regulator transcription factor [Chloroflexota bacterium]
MATVLVAEDDDRQRDLVVSILRSEGHEVIGVEDGNKARDTSRALPPDVAVLDVMMPGLSGHDVCRIIGYEKLDVAVLMLTALGETDDVVTGLELGADDYLPKPYSPRELAARVRALTRRKAKTERSEQTVGNLTVSTETKTAKCDGKLVNLTRMELTVLHTLTSNVERTWTRREIIDAGFGYDYDGTERSIDMHVVNLRRKLADEGWTGSIDTVHGLGYTVGTPVSN